MAWTSNWTSKTGVTDCVVNDASVEFFFERRLILRLLCELLLYHEPSML